MKTTACIALLLLLGSGAVRADDAPDSPSLYDLKVSLIDQRDEEVGLDVHAGRPTVVSMFYAKCPHACPALISDIKRIDAALPKKAAKRVRYLLVSIDPTDETATFRQLIEMHGLDPKRWEITRTDERSIRQVAAALGISYRKLPDESWNHSSIITVLDGEGSILHSVEGLALEHEKTISVLGAAASSEP